METEDDTDMSDWTLQQKAQFVMQKIAEGDLRTEWFFNKLAKQTGVTPDECIQRTFLYTSGYSSMG